MSKLLLKGLIFSILFSACASSSQHKSEHVTFHDNSVDQPVITADAKPANLMDLPQSLDGGFVLSPGLYEAEFKTYCLEPGTPDPRPGDGYYQGPVTGNRKEIVETVLLNSQHHTDIEQKNIQLLLWSVVSNSDFNKLSYAVQTDAKKLLSPKQIFELKGGVMGLIKTVSSSTGIFSANKDMQKLFEMGTASYATYEKLAVLNEASQIQKTGISADHWYKQEGYYVRYYPVNYKKVKIQVYVPDGVNNVVFDPTGAQAIPSFTNSQRLGIGGPLLDMVRVIVQVNKQPRNPGKHKFPDSPKKDTKTNPKYLQ